MTLELFAKHPRMDAYHVGGAYQPYAIVGRDKRFSDAELAAEYHTTDHPAERVTILRFASLPHASDTNYE